MDKPTWLDRRTIKAVVLPTEHGSWAYILEPILFGCLWVQNWSWLVGLGLLVLFLSSRPLLLAFRDIRARKSYPRTKVAFVAATLLGGGGLALVLVPAFLVGQNTGTRTAELLALMALGFAASEVIKTRTSADNPVRLLLVLLTAALALPIIRVQDAVASEWGGYTLVLFRSIPSFLYVRCRLKGVAFGNPTSNLPNWAMLAAGLPILLSLNLLGYGLYPPVVTMCLPYWVLLARATHGLQPHLVGVHSPKQVGLTEAAYGAIWVIALAWSMRALNAMP